jgi:arsenite methyltransferase
MFVMQTDNEIKKIVKEKYGQIAKQSTSCCGPTSCCGTSNNKIVDYTIMKDEYNHLDGYVAEADLGLGCGLPTEHAGIKEGDVVVDIGSGAGNDVL